MRPVEHHLATAQLGRRALLSRDQRTCLLCRTTRAGASGNAVGVLLVHVRLCSEIVGSLFSVPFQLANNGTSSDLQRHFLFAKFQTRPSRNATLASSSLAILTCLVPLIFIPTALFLPTYGRALFAYALGILAAIAASLQYFPQLYTTFVLKRVESLSIPMMCVQTPGSFVWVASLMARLGWEGWSTWGSFLVTACLQGSLLVMAIYYEVGRSRKTAEESASEDDSQTDDNRNDLGEREPLL